MVKENREALKHIAAFNVDAQYCQKYGTVVFAYEGDTDNPDFKEYESNFLKVIDDLMGHLSKMKKCINPEKE